MFLKPTWYCCVALVSVHCINMLFAVNMVDKRRDTTFCVAQFFVACDTTSHAAFAVDFSKVVADTLLAFTDFHLSRNPLPFPFVWNVPVLNSFAADTVHGS